MTLHGAQVQKAIDFIESRLSDDGLTLDAVARHAGYSSWHFQRLFGALVGDTLKEYIRKRRLTRAFETLAKGGDEPRIIDLALDCGFESQEAFSRAFKGLFGMTPGACRKAKGAGIPMPSLLKPRITPDYLDHVFGGLTMVPEIIDVAEMCVAGIAGNFVSAMSPEANNFKVIPKLWDDFLSRIKEIPHKAADEATYGLVYCAQPPLQKSHPDEFRYLAGLRVTGSEGLPAGMELKVVPAGRYARFVHKGKLDTLQHTMRYIFGSWLPKSGHELRDAPDIEVYGEKFNPASDASELEILIPVK